MFFVRTSGRKGFGTVAVPPVTFDDAV